MKNGYEQDAPREKTVGKFSNVVIKGVVVSRGASGKFTREAAGKKTLEMVMHEEDIEVFRPRLIPEGDEPWEGHGHEDNNTEPEAHVEKFFNVFVEDEKSDDTKPGYDDTDEPFCIESAGAGNIEKCVKEEPFSIICSKVPRNKKGHSAHNKECKGAINDHPMGYTNKFP